MFNEIIIVNIFILFSVISAITNWRPKWGVTVWSKFELTFIFRFFFIGLLY